MISGFLMTGIVVQGLERGYFSLFGFYMARARRIVPALVGLCAVLVGWGWFVLLPPDYKMLGSHAVYSLAFLSNIEFWLEAGYFDVASHEKWLLHTWSLSVEWQFYLVLPVLLWVVWRLKPGRVAQTWAVSIGMLVSLAASVLTTEARPTTAFFLLHTRAWEMLGGGLVFLLAGAPRLAVTHRRWLEAIGLLLILASVAVFDKGSAWPGWRAVLPVSAAMMVLAANRSSPWTSNRVSQWLGDRSYSLYLWHWPVYVGLVYAGLRDEYLAIVGGMFVTLILGHLSYSWVENTARRLLGSVRFRYGASLLAAITIAVALPAVAIWDQKGVAGRFAPAVEMAAAEASNGNPRHKECYRDKGRISPSCVVGGQEWKVIAVGDSHVSAIISGLVHAQQNGDAGVVWWAYGGCVFVQGMTMSPTGTVGKGRNYQCPEFIEWAHAQLNILPRKIPIVIINRYALAAFGRNENHSAVDTPEVYFSKTYPVTTPEFLNEFAQHITDSACRLAKQRTVYMMRPIPEMGLDVPRTLSRRMAFGFADDISISVEQYRQRNAWVWAAQDAASEKCGIKILDPLPYLCGDGRCYGSKAGRPMYTDSDHLSEFGNKLLIPMFAEVFKKL